MDLVTIYILGVILVATLVRSTLGFGESLIAVPLLIFVLPAEVAVPVSVLLSIIIALVVVIQDHKKIHFYSAKWLIIYAIPGIPVGIAILLYGSGSLIKLLLGLLIIAYSVYALPIKNKKAFKKDSKLWLIICGFLSGVLGGAYGLNGPPLVVYGNRRQWSAKQFRVTLQAYFLPIGLISVIGYYAKGLITADVGHYFFISLITAIPAIFLGRYLNHRLEGASFFKYVYWGLMVIGVILIIGEIL